MTWGQRLDRATRWLEEPITLPPLAPPTRDPLATAYPERVPGWTYWAVLGFAIALVLIASFVLRG